MAISQLPRLHLTPPPSTTFFSDTSINNLLSAIN